MPIVDFPTDGGTARGYLAGPPAGAGIGLLVLHAPGAERHVEAVCDQFADEGFTALAVDEASKDLTAAIEFLESSDRVRGEGVGVVVYDMADQLASIIAALPADDVHAVVVFGGDVTGETAVPVQVHDARPDVDDEEAVRTAWVRTLEFLRAKLG